MPVVSQELYTKMAHLQIKSNMLEGFKKVAVLIEEKEKRKKNAERMRVWREKNVIKN